MNRQTRVLPPTTPGARLTKRLEPVFVPSDTSIVNEILITGCALFNKPHTDVTAEIPVRKRPLVVGALARIVQETGCAARFVVPGAELLDPRLRDHFHPFMFMAVTDVERTIGATLSGKRRIFGAAHEHARTDAEIAAALDASRGSMIHNIIEPAAHMAQRHIVPVAWLSVIAPYLDAAYRIAHTHTYTAEAIYARRVETRPSYKTLHDMDPRRGLMRTISNNVFYIAEALYLRDHPHVAVVNFEHEDTFWRGLEKLLARVAWGSWRPLIVMAPKPARQPWGY